MVISRSRINLSITSNYNGVKRYQTANILIKSLRKDICKAKDTLNFILPFIPEIYDRWPANAPNPTYRINWFKQDLHSSPAY